MINIDKLVHEHDSDKYYKTFDSWKQFVVLEFGILKLLFASIKIEHEYAKHKHSVSIKRNGEFITVEHSLYFEK